MTTTPVILAILDHVRKEADGYYTVPVGLSDGDAGTLRLSKAAARLFAEELGRVLSAPSTEDAPPILRGIPAVTGRMKQAGAEVLASAIEIPAEDLVTAIYQAMALEVAVVSVGDRL